MDTSGTIIHDSSTTVPRPIPGSYRLVKFVIPSRSTLLQVPLYRFITTALLRVFDSFFSVNFRVLDHLFSASVRFLFILKNISRFISPVCNTSALHYIKHHLCRIGSFRMLAMICCRLWSTRDPEYL